MKRAIKILMIFLLVVALILLIVLAFMQSRLFKNILRDFLEEKANEMLSGAELTIGRIEGNFIGSVKILGIKLEQDGSDLILLDEISLHYSLQRIIYKKIIISKILIDNIDIFLAQNADQIWNIQTLVLPEQNEPEAREQASGGIGWRIELQDFILQDSDISIRMWEDNPMVPAAISDLNIRFEGYYSDSESHFKLKSFSFSSDDPYFELVNISFAAVMRGNDFYLDAMELETCGSKISSDGKINIVTREIEYFNLSMYPLRLREFMAFIPEGLVKTLPDIYLDMELQSQRLQIGVNIEQGGQKFELTARADSIFSEPLYEVDLAISHFDINDWLEIEQPDMDINLNLGLDGRGIDIETAELAITLDLLPSFAGGRTLPYMTLEVGKRGNSAEFYSSIIGEFGNVKLDGRAIDIFDEVSYRLNGTLINIDLAPLALNDSLYTNLNLGFVLEGSGLDTETLTADFRLTSKPSSIMAYELKLFEADLHYDSQDYIIKDISLQSNLIRLKLRGRGNIEDRYNTLDFILQAGEPAYIKELLVADRFQLQGEISGTISTLAENIEARALINFSDLEYNEISLQKMTGYLDFTSEDGDITVDLRLGLSQFISGEYTINSINLHSYGNADKIDNVLDLRAGDAGMHFWAAVLPDSVVIIELNDLQLAYGSLVMHTPHADARLLLGRDSYIIRDFELEGGSGVMKLDGVISPEDSSDVLLTILGLQLDTLNDFGLIDGDIRGELDFSTSFRGSLIQPILQAELNLRDAGWNDVELGELDFSLNLAKNYLSSIFHLDRGDELLIAGSAKFPVYLDSRQNQEMIPYNEQIEAEISLNNLDISILQPFLAQVNKLAGTLNANLSISNTIAEPQIEGSLKFERGKFAMSSWGIDYPELRINSTFSNENIAIEEIYLRGGDGSLTLSGAIELRSPIQEGINSVDLRIFADKFSALNSRDLYLLMNSDIRLYGTQEKPQYSGNIEIARAIINIDKFKGGVQSEIDINSPLLVQSRLQNDPSLPKPDEKKESPQIDIIRNLQGKLDFTIPRNTWIRSKDMNIEIAGDLQIIKDSKDFKIFGNVRTLRGKYEVYGKKFDMQAGTVVFSGEAISNPFLDLKIRHIFRDMNREKRQLDLAISGQAMSPQVNFFLDDEQISDLDAISYLLFGRSSNEISNNEKSQVSQQSNSGLAMSMLSNQIGSQIANQISKKLNLDVIEFSGGENWKQASISVGKYITNDLFVNYKKEFSLSQSREIVPDEVSLEYEISRYFSVQAKRGDEKTTGVDLYWKFKLK